MKFWERNPSAKYRAEGLNLALVDKISQTERDQRSTMLIAALAFVAVGSLAYIGLQTITTPGDVKLVYSAAPPTGTAQQIMMALKNPHEREQERARLALLNDAAGPMEIKSLEKVERLVNPDLAQTDEPAATEQVEQPVVVAAAAPEPVLPTPILPEVQPTPEPEPEIVEIATVETVAEPPAASCVTELQNFASEATIFFDLGSTQITTRDITTLQNLGRMVMTCDEAKVQVTGHSDTTGNDLANLNLSWQRADNVVTALRQIGIDTAKFEPVGFGARAPLAQGDASDEDLNRRVEFVVLRNDG